MSKGSSQKIVFFKEYFLNKGGGFGIPKLFCEILVAIVFGHEIHILSLNLAKIHIFIPRGGTTSLGNIPKKKTIFFYLFPA